MKPIMIPTTDVNSENGQLVSWHVEDGEKVEKGQLIVELETSKALIEVTSPEEGFILRAYPAGSEMPLSQAVAHVFPSEEAAKDYKAKATFAKEETKAQENKGFKASVKAEELAQLHNIDLNEINQGRLITTKDVEAAIAEHTKLSPEQLPFPLTAEFGIERVLLIGAGLGATQVIDIFRNSPKQMAVGILDDSAEKWGAELYGVPIVGGTNRIKELFEQGLFDSVIVAISTSVPARTKFRTTCKELNIPMANAIDTTSKLAADVSIGTGNVICAFCHFGTNTVIGDNNFFSAYNSFDHHCKLGSDISTGPGCMTSGCVTIGSRVRMGTGIFAQPCLEVGDDVKIASGAIIVKSVPAKHSVKTKVVTTAVVPLQR